jgi:spermidine synthase
MKSLDENDAQYNESELIISDQEVMQDWEYSLMHNLADKVTSKGGDILEVGFGMGISASKIIENDINSYTVIECNPTVIDQFQSWKERYPHKKINVIVGRWQDVINQLEQYDGIIFDAYPIDETDWFENALNSCSYAEQFFEIAATHLRKDGVFTYYTGEIDSISNEHQRQLFRHFCQINISVQPNLHPPIDCTYWWNNKMAVVSAIK